MMRGGAWAVASGDLLAAACGGLLDLEPMPPRDARGPASGVRPEACWMETERDCVTVLGPPPRKLATACRPLGDPSLDCFDVWVAPPDATRSSTRVLGSTDDDDRRTPHVCVPLEAR